MGNSQDKGVEPGIKSPLLYQQGARVISRVCVSHLNTRTPKGSENGSNTVGEEVVCAACGHEAYHHLVPGSECVAIVGEELNGDAEFCPCSRFVSPGTVVEPARAERSGGSGAQPPSVVPACVRVLGAVCGYHQLFGSPPSEPCGTGAKRACTVDNCCQGRWVVGHGRAVRR